MNTLSSALFFMLKKVCQDRPNFHITYYSGLVRVSQTFLATDLYLQIFFIMDPNFMSHQFSAQPTRKDKANPKINNTKSVKKLVLINGHRPTMSSYLQPLLYFVFNYNQLFFWMQIKTNCYYYYCYYYYYYY